MLFRSLRRYKLKNLYVCRISSIPIMQDINISEKNIVKENRILFFNSDSFFDPITGEYFILQSISKKNYVNSNAGLIIKEIIGRIDYVCDLEDDIYLRGDYLKLADIIKFDSIIKNKDESEFKEFELDFS